MKQNDNVIDFSSLALIPLILEQNKELLNRVEKLEEILTPKIDLTKSKGVMLYLDISKSTLTRKIKDGEFKRGVHYIQAGIGENRRFIPEAIKEYKQQSNKFKVNYSAI